MLPDIPYANSPWFTFLISSSAGRVPYAVYEFSGTERMNEPFEFSIEFVARDINLPTTNFLGKEALLSISDRSGGIRKVHGLIRQMLQLHTGNRFTHYRCLLVPRLWFLGETVEHKIFQHRTVAQIIDDVLKNQRFTAEEYEFQLHGKYPKRGYCTQYGESDLHFISRLCEEEGITWHFTHSDAGHCLVFSDVAGGPPILGAADLRFHPGSGNPADTAVIARLTHQQRINSDSASYREWNFTTPSLDLSVNKREPDWNKAPAPQAVQMDSYRFPHLYQKKDEGERYAEVQLLRQLTYREWIEGSADVSRFTPGHTFLVNSHPRLELNRQWLVTKVSHKGEQPAVLEHEAPGERGMQYNASFTAIPAETRFVPEARHKKSKVDGIQSAIVTGPKGEEIFVDEYGRVKVRFHWDRIGEWDETTSCWVRVSQGWAGGDYGAMAVPRIGHEVLVSFLEGDPDRPLITGRVYNAANKVPYELPDNKTRSVYKSHSTPGGEGFNELRIEDKKGEEEIYLHAQKNLHTHTRNNWRDSIGNDVHRTVGRNTYLTTQGETHEIFEGVHKSQHKANVHQSVDGDSHFAITGKWLGKAEDEIHLKSGIKGVIECGTELTLKAGSGFIKLDPSGVTIVGSAVKINSGGSPGSGTGANPELPDESKEVAAGKIPEYAPVQYTVAQLARMEKAAQTHAMLCDVCVDMQGV